MRLTGSHHQAAALLALSPEHQAVVAPPISTVCAVIIGLRYDRVTDACPAADITKRWRQRAHC